MGLDIRIPIGILFTILGILLVGFGIVTMNDQDLYRRSLNFNINLWWGIALLVFGVPMLLFGWLRPRRVAPEEPAPGAEPPVAGRPGH